MKDLTLLDRFLFDQTMENTEAHEAMLQIILGQEDLKLLTHAQTEKELRTAPGCDPSGWMCTRWIRPAPSITPKCRPSSEMTSSSGAAIIKA